MQYFYYDIESFSFEGKTAKPEDISNNNFLKKNTVSLKKLANNKVLNLTVLNFRLLNANFPIPLKEIEILSLEVFNENDGKMLHLDNKHSKIRENKALVELSTTINSYKNYKTFEFNTLLPASEIDLILSETKYMNLSFKFTDIENNVCFVSNQIYFKKIALIKDIKYRKVSKCITTFLNEENNSSKD